MGASGWPELALGEVGVNYLACKFTCQRTYVWYNIGMVELVPEEVDVAYEMVGIRQAIDELELQFSRLAARFDKGSYWEQEGSNSPIDWIRFNCHMTSNAAGARIAVGENLGRMAESTQAMQAGEIGFTHLVEMARTAEAVGEAFDELKLLKLARENSPGKFHYKCMHYRHSVDARAVAKEQAELAETRFLHLNTQDDGGLFLTGLLDPVGERWCATRSSRWRA